MTRGIDNRKHVRQPLTGDLGGSLISVASGSTVPCVAVDVSSSGMRIVVGIDLDLGAQMILALAGRKIPLEVVWCEKDKERRGRFSCGLRRVVETDDLANVFAQIGWAG